MPFNFLNQAVADSSVVPALVAGSSSDVIPPPLKTGKKVLTKTNHAQQAEQAVLAVFQCRDKEFPEALDDLTSLMTADNTKYVLRSLGRVDKRSSMARGAALYHLKNNKQLWPAKYKGNWSAFAAGELKDICERDTADHLIVGYERTLKAGIPWAKVEALGPTKLRHLANHLTQENVDTHVLKAVPMSVSELKDYVTETFGSDEAKEKLDAKKVAAAAKAAAKAAKKLDSNPKDGAKGSKKTKAAEAPSANTASVPAPSAFDAAPEDGSDDEAPGNEQPKNKEELLEGFFNVTPSMFAGVIPADGEQRIKLLDQLILALGREYVLDRVNTLFPL
jgi:hypothetical protein